MIGDPTKHRLTLVMWTKENLGTDFDAIVNNIRVGKKGPDEAGKGADLNPKKPKISLPKAASRKRKAEESASTAKRMRQLFTLVNGKITRL